MSWPIALLALGAALMAIALPGLAAAAALRLRPLVAIAYAAPVSLAIQTVAAEVGAFLRVPWAVTAASALLASAAVLSATAPAPPRRRHHRSLRPAQPGAR